jgi:hypothetical protein
MANIRPQRARIFKVLLTNLATSGQWSVISGQKILSTGH